MGVIWDFFVIVSLAALVLGPVFRGELPPEFGAVALGLLVILRALGRARGGWLNRAVRTTFAIGIPLTALLLFITTQGQGELEKMVPIVVGVGTILLALLGLYIMIRGLFT